jgi:Fic family protein
MDQSSFGERSPGQLVQVATPEPDWAFVPVSLPSPWELPTELVQLLIQAREALARLDGAGRYMPANTLLLRPLQQREALRSSSLEGTFATAEELLVYEMEPKEPTSSADPANAWREVFNYDRALQQGQQLLLELPISNRLIRELHATLLGGVRGGDRTPGEYRTRQVHIGADRRFIPPPANNVPDLMAELERYINSTDPTDPLIRSFLAHYQFETIHPFLDGNGRVGRLILSLMVYNACGLQKPWLYLSAYFDRYKDDYISKLFNVSSKGDWISWVRFCLQATVAQAKDAMNRIDKLLVLKSTYEQRIIENDWPSRMQKMVASLFGSPMITVPRIAKQFDITFPTAKSDVEKLIGIGVLEESKRKAKPQYYVAPEIFEAAYSEAD